MPHFVATHLMRIYKSFNYVLQHIGLRQCSRLGQHVNPEQDSNFGPRLSSQDATAAIVFYCLQLQKYRCTRPFYLYNRFTWILV